MAIVRFVHAADLHLDSPFRGLLAADGRVAGTLRQATFKAYDNIVSLCIDEKVDALLIAGDVFDSADRSLQAQLAFIQGLRRLDEAGIRSFVCHGNHDPLDGWEARLDHPAKCHRFTSEVEAVPVFPGEPGRAVVHGVSYPTRDVRHNLIPSFQRGATDGFAIGLVHANVGANTGHENYAPCTLSDLEDSGFDYWALGHVHTRQVMREVGPTVVYPGNPQGRHPNETGERGVYLVEVADSGVVSLEFRAVDLVRWERAEVSIDGLNTEQDLLDRVETTVADLRDGAGGRDVVVRLTIAGRGPLHGSLRRADFTDQLRDDINEQWNQEAPFVYCERVTVATASLIDREQRRQADDFLGDLLRLVDSISDDPEQLNGLMSELDPLYGNRRVAQGLENSKLTHEDLVRLLRDAEEICMDGLIGEEAS